MEIDYSVAGGETHIDPMAPDEESVWVLNYYGTNPYQAHFTDPRRAIDRLAATVADRHGGTFSLSTATEDVLAHFNDPAAEDGFHLEQRPVDVLRGGGWPAFKERLLPTGPGVLHCICHDEDEAFAVCDVTGTVVEAYPAEYLLHMGCGRIAESASALVLGRVLLCQHCGVPIALDRDKWQWRHITVTAGRTVLPCFDDEASGMQASPAEGATVEEQRWPMPGDAVLLTSGIAGAPAGAVGVIDGMVGEVATHSAITFAAAGRLSVYRDDKVVRCSGGPGTIVTDLSELEPTDVTEVLTVWQFRNGTRRAGHREAYQVRVPVWTWPPKQ